MHNICVYHITMVFIIIVIIIMISVYDIRKENFYPIKTEDQSTFIRDAILHYHNWRKTEIDEGDFIEYVKRYSKADKNSGLIV